MGYRTTRGMILSRRDLFERDQEIVLLTPEFGGITARAPHARSSQKTYCGRLEPPNEVRARLYRARENSRWTVSEVSLETVLADVFEQGSREDVWPLLSLYRDLFQEGKPARDPYARLRHGLRLLQEGFEPVKLVVARVLARAAVSQGLELPLDACVECGRKAVGEPGVLAFEQGFVCRECASGESPSRFPLRPGSRRLLKSLLREPWDRVVEGTVSREDLVEVESLLYRLFHFHFDISVEALRVRRELNSA